MCRQFARAAIISVSTPTRAPVEDSDDFVGGRMVLAVTGISPFFRDRTTLFIVLTCRLFPSVTHYRAQPLSMN